MASKFNETVAVDLHQLDIRSKTAYYPQMIDLFTMFSVAALIFDRNRIRSYPECFNFVFLKFGPKSFFTDNGGEFNNENFRKSAEN